MSALILAAVLAQATGDLDGDGKPDVVRVHADGRVAAEGFGEVQLSAARLTKASVAIRAVGKHAVIEARGGKGALAAAVKGGALQVLWSGEVGPLGRDGETTRVLEVTGGAVLVYEQSVSAVRCDGEVARLAAQAWDWDSGRMRAVQILPELRGLPHLSRRTATTPTRGPFALPNAPWRGTAGDFVTLRVAQPVAVRAVGISGKAGKLVLTVGRERFLVEGEGWYALPRPIAADCVMLVPAEGPAEIADVRVEADAPKLPVAPGAAPAAVQDPHPAVPELLAELGQAQEFERRVKLLRALGRSADAAAAEPLEKVARSDSDEIIRYEATRALGALPAPAGEPVLREALKDASPRVRDAAAVGLAPRHTPEATAALVETLRHDRWMFVRRDAAEALGAHCGTDVTLALRGAVESKDEDDDVRRATLAALVRCKDAQAPRLLAMVLGSAQEDRHLREEACTLLGATGDRGAVGPMTDALRRARSEGGDWIPLGVACARSLAPVADAPAEKLLVEIAGDPAQPPLQIAAAEALGRICSPAARAALEKAAADKSPLLRRAGRDSLDRCSHH